MFHAPGAPCTLWIEAASFCGLFMLFPVDLFYLFIYFWLRWVFVAVCGLLIALASLVAEHRL